MIHVAVAVLENQAGQILIQQRPDKAHQGGLWEFPGGKVEAGETLAQALKREIHEELGIRVTVHRPLIQIRHDYGDRAVLLDVHRVLGWQGEPQAREAQPLQWVSPGQLTSWPMPAADVPIIRAIQLPSSYVITPPDISDASHFLEQLDALLIRGERLFLYRTFKLEGLAHDQLVSEMKKKIHQAHGHLILHELYRDTAQADGLHVSEKTLMASRDVVASDVGLISASCHSLQALIKAEFLNVDFVMLSPVNETASHPEARPMGWVQFRELVSQVNLPVFALGGVQSTDHEKSWQQGGQGVAGISHWWS